MGTITPRRRQNGGIAYLARIRLKSNGIIIHAESKTLETHKRAKEWIRDREAELAQPGAIDRAKDDAPTLSDAIERYMREMTKEVGRTKTGNLERIAGMSIGKKKCHLIKSADIVSLARELKGEGRQAQSVAGYISNLASIFEVARPAWGMELDRAEMDAAQVVAKNLGLIASSGVRDRRPTIDEIERLMTFFADRLERMPAVVPMLVLVPFAIFSTRRQNEIVTIKWDDLDREGKRVLIRDMKHPGEKIGNDVWCDLNEQAMSIIEATPRVSPVIFPYHQSTVSQAFTHACHFLQIENLHFHDLRHDGISRLFEMGWNIPHVAAVSGHRSWSSLKRYTHIRQSGDKYAGWPWIERVTRRSGPRLVVSDQTAIAAVS